VHYAITSNRLRAVEFFRRLPFGAPRGAATPV
jgi:hypothetical protein